ncbi:MAG: type II toxin-antitoxin system HicB family antitoxin [Draconibacterium sp.]|nr:type II toxin-antitoxin system HicB family antitoxin [Draconibacterium sp.]
MPGCVTYGENVDEAIDMAKEAIQLYLEELKERGETIPNATLTKTQHGKPGKAFA